MTSSPVDPAKDTAPDPELEYRALLRSLRRTRDFGLFFVQCSPAEGERIIQRIRDDLPQKQIEVLTLTGAIDNLYDVVDALPNKDQIEILFIQGLERSLYEYEKEKLWNDSSEHYGYSEKGIPKLLAHLNLSRERFREHFRICFVFLLPLFALKYLMRRTPDFFDWRSGVLDFRSDADKVERDSFQIWVEGYYQNYRTWTPEHVDARILEIQALLEEPFQANKTALLIDQGNLFNEASNYEAAIVCYRRALELEPNNDVAWNNEGNALRRLGRYKEAVASYENALIIKPNDVEIIYNRGLALKDLGFYEEAISAFDKALESEPLFYKAWYGRGFVLSELGHCQEAIICYDKVLSIQSDFYPAWNARGADLDSLGFQEEALASYEQALKVQPTFEAAWYNRGFLLQGLGRYIEAIQSYDKSLECLNNDTESFYQKACCYSLLNQANSAVENLKEAIALNPEYREKAKTDSDFDNLRQDERFRALVEARPGQDGTA